MRVLMLSNLFPPDYDGGYELNAWKLARGLRDRGVEVEVATSLFRPGFAPVPEEPWIHRLFELRSSILGTALGGVAGKIDAFRRLAHNEGMTPGNLRALRRLLRGRTYDVAYVFGLHHVGVGITKALTERDIPILWHFGDHHLAERMGYWDTSATYRLAGKTVFRDHRSGEAGLDLGHTAFVSQFLLDYFVERGVPLKRTYIVPRGIEYALGTDVERPRESPPVILMAGRIVPDKGYHNAIQAASALLRRRPDLDWRLRIVGGGEAGYLADLREMTLSLGGRVEFSGKIPRDDLVRMLREATVFVSASTWGEPFANTIIETLGAGTPLVGADSGSILEVVEHGESALVFPKNDPAALSQELERVLDDPELRNSLARKGVSRIAEAYTLDKILDRTERILTDLANGPRV